MRDSGPGLAEVCGAQEVESEVRRGPVDLLVVADQSPSMNQEWDTLGALLSSLVAAAGVAGIETRVAASEPIVGCPTCDLIDVEVDVEVEVDYGNALQVLATSDVFLDREDGVLELLVLTDNESSLSAAAFVQAMSDRLLRPFRVHSVAGAFLGAREDRICGSVSEECRAEFLACELEGEERSELECLDVVSRSCAVSIEATFGDCEGGGACATTARAGQRYEWLARVTGGTFASMCRFDDIDLFEPLLERLMSDREQRVLPCEVVLSDEAGIDRDEIRVSLTREGAPDQVLPQVTSCRESLAFRRVGDTLTLCPSVCEVPREPGEALRIDFGCG